VIRVVALLVVIASATCAYAQRWWDTKWRYRRPIKLEGEGAGFTDWAFARFWASAALKKDASDIRVVTADGRVCKTLVIWAEPYGRVELVFKTYRGVRRYFVYYNNPDAVKLEVKERPRVGLIMETRSRPRGPCNSWADFKRLLERSKVVYGRGIVRRIFSGFNPWGPSDHYMTIYRGWLWVPKDGKYRIATNSDESSFVFIDGRMVVAWAGRHGPTAVYGERNAEVQLKKGLHRIEYYHEETEGGQACVLGWWRPGDKRVYLVEQKYFPTFLETKVGRLQRYGADFSVEIRPKPVSEAQLPGGHLIVEIAFRALTRNAPANVTFEWDFGDGQKAKGDSIRHLFLHPGRYRVKLTAYVGKKKEVAYLQSYVGFSFFYRQRSRAKEYCRMLKDYDFGKMDAEGLKAVVALAEVGEDEGLRLRALEAGITRGIFKGRDLWRALRDAAKLLVEREGSAAKAEGYLKRLLGEVKDLWWRAQAELGLGDVAFYLRRDFKKALSIYQGILTHYATESPGCAKRAQIRIGDVYRIMGRYGEAQKAYERARLMSAMFYREDANVRRGRFILETHHLIEARQYENALQRLDDWEWQLPQDKLTTEFSLLRARALARSNRWKLALLELEGFVNANTAKDCEKPANCLPETLLALAKVQAKLGKWDKALGSLQRILKEHKEAEEVCKEAQRLLERWSNKPQKRQK